MRPLALFALLTTLAPWAAGQRGATVSAVHAVAPARSTARINRAGTFPFGRGARSFSRLRRSSAFAPYVSLPFPFFGDSFDPDDIYSTGYPVASEPPAYLLQSLRALAGSNNSMDFSSSMGPEVISGNAHDAQSSQPLMIELQDDRYVRVNHAAIDGEALPLHLEPNDRPRAKSSEDAFSATLRSTARDLPPAVLIFRDGHSEEVHDYTISEGMLYAHGDFYTDGYWNKTIALSNLNIPQTQQANAGRNVKFILPSSPNEVITSF